LRCLYPRDTGNILDFSQDSNLSAAFADLVAVREEIAHRQQIEAELKQRIQQRMGDATKALFETGSVSWKRSRDGSGIDLGKLLLEQPDLPERYPLTKPGSRRFLITV
ncbi:MAG TPA: endonuclease, partial [Undibacterium sp.]|nr:endonuclease [Undibacterium sp.]